MTPIEPVVLIVVVVVLAIRKVRISLKVVSIRKG